MALNSTVTAQESQDFEKREPQGSAKVVAILSYAGDHFSLRAIFLDDLFEGAHEFICSQRWLTQARPGIFSEWQPPATIFNHETLKNR